MDAVVHAECVVIPNLVKLANALQLQTNVMASLSKAAAMALLSLGARTARYRPKIA